MSIFVHAQGIKTVHPGRGGSKNGKMLSTLFLNDPSSVAHLACTIRSDIHKDGAGETLDYTVQEHYLVM